MSDAIFRLRAQGIRARFFWDFDEMVPVLAELFADGSRQVIITVVEGEEYERLCKALDTGAFV